MRRALAFLLLVAGIAGSSASAKPQDQLFGIVGAEGKADLASLDPTTLAPLGRRSRLGTAGPWSFSPAGTLVAIATGMPAPGARATPVALRVISLTSMRRIARVQLGPDPRVQGENIEPVVAVAWLGETRVVVVRQLASSYLQVVVVDVAARRVVRRTPLRGIVVDSAPTLNELVLLLGEPDKIVAPRLVAVDAAGDQREVVLSPIRAGSAPSADPAGVTELVHELHQPGFAVDPDSQVAYVVGENGVVAEVRLGLLDVSYRYLRGTFSKLANGVIRNAVLVRPGLLAVAGTTYTIGTNDAGERTTLARDAGLELLDTKTWQTKRVRAGASWVGRCGDGVVYNGATGLGVVAADGSERFRVLEGEPVLVAGVYHDRAYAFLPDRRERVVVDVVSGTVLDRRFARWPSLLLDRRSWR